MSEAGPWQKLPCSCRASVSKDGYMFIEAEGFLCEARHKQGDLVEVREGLARVSASAPADPPEDETEFIHAMENL